MNNRVHRLLVDGDHRATVAQPCVHASLLLRGEEPTPQHLIPMLEARQHLHAPLSSSALETIVSLRASWHDPPLRQTFCFVFPIDMAELFSPKGRSRTTNYLLSSCGASGRALLQLLGDSHPRRQRKVTNGVVFSFFAPKAPLSFSLVDNGRPLNLSHLLRQELGGVVHQKLSDP